jgi:hypothetical protein
MIQREGKIHGRNKENHVKEDWKKEARVPIWRADPRQTKAS